MNPIGHPIKRPYNFLRRFGRTLTKEESFYSKRAYENLLAVQNNILDLEDSMDMLIRLLDILRKKQKEMGKTKRRIIRSRVTLDHIRNLWNKTHRHYIEEMTIWSKEDDY